MLVNKHNTKVGLNKCSMQDICLVKLNHEQDCLGYSRKAIFKQAPTGQI